MADDKDKEQQGKLPAAPGAAPQGDDAVTPGASGGHRLTGSHGIASGVQRGGTNPGGGPGAGLGSIGTGGAASGGAASGSVKRGGS
jgi:hypothetical protein